jgi:DNA polymerase elongation subunit (family B)
MVKLRLFPLDFEYVEENGQGFVYMYGRESVDLNEAKASTIAKKLCVKVMHDSYCFIRLAGVDEEKLKRYLDECDVKVKFIKKITKRLFAKDENFLQITLTQNSAIKIIEKKLEEKEVEIYEADINPIQRFLISYKINPLQELKCDGELIDGVEGSKITVPLYLGEATTIKHCSEKNFTNPKILAIDIETYNEVMDIDMEKNPILMIAVYGKDEKGKLFRKVLTYKRFKTKHKYIEFLENEKAMLERCCEIINEFDPDILTSYFGDGFDLPYIAKRAAKFGVPFEIGKDSTSILVPRFKRRTRVVGIIHADIYKFVRYIFGTNWRLDSYSLDNVATELLGEKKHQVDLSSMAEDWNKNRGLEKYAEYNLQDTKLTFEITEKLYLALLEFCQTVQVPPDDLIRMRFSRLVEAYLLKRGDEMNIINPNKPNENAISARRGRQIQGAFVFEPVPGLYKDVVVFDFLSLYPTIIVSHNIGAETVAVKKTDATSGALKVPERNYYINKKPKSMMATVLAEIISMRVELKKERNKRIQKNQDVSLLDSKLYSLKILANSFYGYFAFYGARWYSFEGADAITAFARDYIKKVIKGAGDAGFKVIYSDTDSVMIALGSKTQDEAHSFVDSINAKLPGSMELEYEGFFPRAIFVGMRGKTGGAKKKYALIDEKGKMKITGFATVRRNTSLIAKEIQKEFLGYVLRDEVDIGIKYLKEMVKAVKDHKVSVEKMIIKTQLTRALSSYTAIGPHVAVAQRMKKEGIAISKGMLIEYVVQEGKGIIRERSRRLNKMDSKYDSDYYLKNQVIPAVSAILEVVGYSEKELLENDSGKQQGLKSFV